MYEGLDILQDVPLEQIRVIRHEDLYYNSNDVMRAIAEFISVDYHSCLETITFGNRLWWSDSIYDMDPMNTVNPKVVSFDWQKQIDMRDWFTFEGLFNNYLIKYGYKFFKYEDGIIGRIKLFLVMLIPSKIEREVFLHYLSYSNTQDFIKACLDESSGRVTIKDYSFNAYYRHKWTQKDLRLYRSRFFVEFLKKSLKKSTEVYSIKNRLRLKLAQFIYCVVNICRYISSVALCPIMLFRRWRVTGKSFLRMIQNKNVLPEALSVYNKHE